MGNGENLIILLLLNYYANSSSTLSVINFSVINYSGAFFNLSPSPPQPAGCVTATPLLLLLFENLLRHFQNTDSVGTEPKEAAYAITGENADKWDKDPN